MSNKRIDFLKDVRHEIDMLKQYATEEEKGKLNIERFNALQPASCLYGQMFDGCQLPRSKELMDLGCIRVMELEDGVGEIENVSIEDKVFNINGENKGQGWELDEEGEIINRSYRYLSALEGYICTRGANIKGIMDYIKGESETLEL